MWSSSNPVLARDDAFSEFYGKDMRLDVPTTTTLAGVVNKTLILVSITVVAGVGGYMFHAKFPSLLMVSAILNLIVGIGMTILLCRKPLLSPVLAPVYAVVEGAFLGAFTALVDNILISRGQGYLGGVGLQAFVITVSVAGGMLMLYRAGIIRPTKTFQAVLRTAVIGIAMAYLLTFALSFFNIQMPLLGIGSAVADQGLMGLLGLGLNVIILIVASLCLVMDFKLIEDQVAAGAPKAMEWYCGFALLVTLAWIYYESVKLMLRLSTILGRD